MKVLLVFITRLFLTVLAIALVICCIGIAFVLFDESQLFFKQIGESILKLFGLFVTGLSGWFIGIYQIKWWNKFLKDEK